MASRRPRAILGLQVSQPLDDPRAELEALAHATRRAARRQQALGRRELPRAKQKAASAGPARTAEDVRAQAAAAPDLATLRACVSRCEACGLAKTRTQTVFMDGAGTRKLLFVGEAPGADEDQQGVPFVGRAGKLLTDIVEKGMGIPRQEVAIANVLKCRPPENREPTPAEKATCTPWLDRQVELLNPAVIVPLGRHAAMHVLGVEASMGAMRARVHARGGRQIVPTYHPAYLLRSPGEKKECWKDIQLAMGVLGMPVPARPVGGSMAEGR